MTGRSLNIVILAGLAACAIGPTVGRFGPARDPGGVRGSFALADTARTQLAAEVLTVRDTDLVVLAKGRIALLPYGLIAYARFKAMGWDVDFGRATPPDSARREHLRLVSRYPQGITPDLLQRLLAAYHQAGPWVLGQ